MHSRPLRNARSRWVTRLAAALALSALVGSASGGQPSQPLTGRLSTESGLPVLEIWGTPQQAAYSQGYLCAETIVTLFDDYILDPRITPNVGVYEGSLRVGVRRQFAWPSVVEEELAAMLRGAVDRLGAERVRSQKLDRALDVDDLMIANCLADWFGLMCSSFSVWGRLSPDGETLTGRNLDFPFTASMQRAQIVLIRRADAGKPACIGVTWPGLIGVYTAMSAAGVTLSMHDANGLPARDVLGFTPRSLTMRAALQTARPASFVADIRKVLENQRVLVGNNILVSVPAAAADPPAAIFEYDGAARDGGVTIRLPQCSGDLAADRLYCTNHLRQRQEPRACDRYEALDRELSQRSARGAPIDVAQAFELLDTVRQSTTLHSVVVRPAARRIHIRIPALAPAAVTFELDSWLQRPTEAVSPRE